MLLNRGVLAVQDFVESAPLVLDLIDVKPIGRELVTLSLESLLTATEDLDLGVPLLDLALELLNEGDEGDSRRSRGGFDRVLFEIVTSFRDCDMSFFHRSSEFRSESTEDISLPGIVFRVDLALYLLVIDDGDSKRSLGFRVVESRTSFANFEEELLPRRELISELRVNVLGFEVPE